MHNSINTAVSTGTEFILLVRADLMNAAKKIKPVFSVIHHTGKGLFASSFGKSLNRSVGFAVLAHKEFEKMSINIRQNSDSCEKLGQEFLTDLKAQTNTRIDTIKNLLKGAKD